MDLLLQTAIDSATPLAMPPDPRTQGAFGVSSFEASHWSSDDDAGQLVKRSIIGHGADVGSSNRTRLASSVRLQNDGGYTQQQMNSDLLLGHHGGPTLLPSRVLTFSWISISFVAPIITVLLVWLLVLLGRRLRQARLLLVNNSRHHNSNGNKSRIFNRCIPLTNDPTGAVRCTRTTSLGTLASPMTSYPAAAAAAIKSSKPTTPTRLQSTTKHYLLDSSSTSDSSTSSSTSSAASPSSAEIRERQRRDLGKTEIDLLPSPTGSGGQSDTSLILDEWRSINSMRSLIDHMNVYLLTLTYQEIIACLIAFLIAILNIIRTRNLFCCNLVIFILLTSKLLKLFTLTTFSLSKLIKLFSLKPIQVNYASVSGSFSGFHQSRLEDEAIAASKADGNHIKYRPSSTDNNNESTIDVNVCKLHRKQKLQIQRQRQEGSNSSGTKLSRQNATELINEEITTIAATPSLVTNRLVHRHHQKSKQVMADESSATICRLIVKEEEDEEERGVDSGSDGIVGEQERRLYHRQKQQRQQRQFRQQLVSEAGFASSNQHEHNQQQQQQQHHHHHHRKHNQIDNKINSITDREQQVGQLGQLNRQVALGSREPIALRLILLILLSSIGALALLYLRLLPSGNGTGVGGGSGAVSNSLLVQPFDAAHLTEGSPKSSNKTTAGTRIVAANSGDWSISIFDRAGEAISTTEATTKYTSGSDAPATTTTSSPLTGAAEADTANGNSRPSYQAVTSSWSSRQQSHLRHLIDQYELSNFLHLLLNTKLQTSHFTCTLASDNYAPLARVGALILYSSLMVLILLMSIAIQRLGRNRLLAFAANSAPVSMLNSTGEGRYDTTEFAFGEEHFENGADCCMFDMMNLKSPRHSTTKAQLLCATTTTDSDAFCAGANGSAPGATATGGSEWPSLVLGKKVGDSNRKRYSDLLRQNLRHHQSSLDLMMNLNGAGATANGTSGSGNININAHRNSGVYNRNQQFRCSANSSQGGGGAKAKNNPSRRREQQIATGNLLRNSSSMSSLLCPIGTNGDKMTAKIQQNQINSVTRANRLTDAQSVASLITPNNLIQQQCRRSSSQCGNVTGSSSRPHYATKLAWLPLSNSRAATAASLSNIGLDSTFNAIDKLNYNRHSRRRSSTSGGHSCPDASAASAGAGAGASSTNHANASHQLGAIGEHLVVDCSLDERDEHSYSASQPTTASANSDHNNQNHNNKCPECQIQQHQRASAATGGKEKEDHTSTAGSNSTKSLISSSFPSPLTRYQQQQKQLQSQSKSKLQHEQQTAVPHIEETRRGRYNHNHQFNRLLVHQQANRNRINYQELKQDLKLTQALLLFGQLLDHAPILLLLTLDHLLPEGATSGGSEFNGASGWNSNHDNGFVWLTLLEALALPILLCSIDSRLGSALRRSLRPTSASGSHPSHLLLSSSGSNLNQSSNGQAAAAAAANISGSNLTDLAHGMDGHFQQQRANGVSQAPITSSSSPVKATSGAGDFILGPSSSYPDLIFVCLPSNGQQRAGGLDPATGLHHPWNAAGKTGGGVGQNLPIAGSPSIPFAKSKANIMSGNTNDSLRANFALMSKGDSRLLSGLAAGGGLKRGGCALVGTADLMASRRARYSELKAFTSNSKKQRRQLALASGSNVTGGRSGATGAILSATRRLLRLGGGAGGSRNVEANRRRRKQQEKRSSATHRNGFFTFTSGSSQATNATSLDGANNTAESRGADETRGMSPTSSLSTLIRKFNHDNYTSVCQLYEQQRKQRQKHQEEPEVLIHGLDEPTDVEHQVTESKFTQELSLKQSEDLIGVDGSLQGTDSEDRILCRKGGLYYNYSLKDKETIPADGKNRISKESRSARINPMLACGALKASGGKQISFDVNVDAETRTDVDTLQENIVTKPKEKVNDIVDQNPQKKGEKRKAISVKQQAITMESESSKRSSSSSSATPAAAANDNAKNRGAASLLANNHSDSNRSKGTIISNISSVQELLDKMNGFESSESMGGDLKNKQQVASTTIAANNNNGKLMAVGVSGKASHKLPQKSRVNSSSNNNSDKLIVSMDTNGSGISGSNNNNYSSSGQKESSLSNQLRQLSAIVACDYEDAETTMTTSGGGNHQDRNSAHELNNKRQTKTTSSPFDCNKQQQQAQSSSKHHDQQQPPAAIIFDYSTLRSVDDALSLVSVSSEFEYHNINSGPRQQPVVRSPQPPPVADDKSNLQSRNSNGNRLSQKRSQMDKINESRQIVMESPEGVGSSGRSGDDARFPTFFAGDAISGNSGPTGSCGQSPPTQKIPNPASNNLVKSRNPGRVSSLAPASVSSDKRSQFETASPVPSGGLTGQDRSKSSSCLLNLSNARFAAAAAASSEAPSSRMQNLGSNAKVSDAMSKNSNQTREARQRAPGIQKTEHRPISVASTTITKHRAVARPKTSNKNLVKMSQFGSRENQSTSQLTSTSSSNGDCSLPMETGNVRAQIRKMERHQNSSSTNLNQQPAAERQMNSSRSVASIPNAGGGQFKSRLPMATGQALRSKTQMPGSYQFGASTQQQQQRQPNTRHRG